MIKPHELMHSACGTPGYVAPEVLRNEGAGYGKEVDLWGIGVILYVLLCGFPPFYDENNSKLFQLIQSGEFEYPSPYWDAVSPEAINLIDKLLVLDPSQRLTAKQALKHTWLCDDIAAKELPHFSQNMRAFNARRRMKGAMRAVLMAHISRPSMLVQQPPMPSASSGHADADPSGDAAPAQSEAGHTTPVHQDGAHPTPEATQ
jgi:serine/threonine protein kinase